jgi:hypothetical protein
MSMVVVAVPNIPLHYQYQPQLPSPDPPRPPLHYQQPVYDQAPLLVEDLRILKLDFYA